MSPISITLNLLLAAMLGLTLWVGWRLNRRLSALRDSQAQFAAAVADLDRAAARAERGLADLRAAGDETLELLSGRVEKGRELAARLERLNNEARATLDRVPEPAPAAAPVKAALPAAIAALQKVWAPKPAAEPSIEEAEAAAESLVLKLSKAEALDEVRDEPRIAQFVPRPRPASPGPKSRTIVDDDLFETPARPAPRILAGDR